MKHQPLDTDFRPDLRGIAMPSVKQADSADRWLDAAAERAAQLSHGDDRALSEIIDAFTNKARAILRAGRSK